MSRLCVVHIVSWNNEETIVPCLQSVLEQRHFTLGNDLKIHVTDNASSDDTAKKIREEFGDRITLEVLDENTGFTGAHNRGVFSALEQEATHVLLLNPDVRLEPEALDLLVRALENDPSAGSCTPKLLRADSRLEAVVPHRIDTTGMYVTPTLRHFDRGSEEVDSDTYAKEEYVFGASGAAILLSRRFILDVALRHLGERGSIELFDREFFAYREDADLAWRGQWLGWRCRFVPQAIGYHERVVLPNRRDALPAELNRMSVRNRFLLQRNNASLAANFRCILPGLWRNLLVIGGVLTVERSSLPALGDVWRGLGRAGENRKIIRSRRRAAAWMLARWFRAQPYSEPALPVVEKTSSSKCEHIAAVIVNYNSGSHLGNCLRELIAAGKELPSEKKLRIVVWDNASKDASAKRVEPMFEPFDNVTFAYSKSNEGFSGGINSALAVLQENDRAPDAVLILNPDVIMNGSALRKLIEALEKHPRLGAISPTLVGEDGAAQLQYLTRNFPSLGSVLAELFYLHRLWPKNPWTSEYMGTNNRLLEEYLSGESGADGGPQADRNKPFIVAQPAGAALFVRNTALEELNDFDESFWPAWYEDVDFCKRLKEKDWLCAVLAAARTTHAGGHSLDAISAQRFFEAWYSNLVRYTKKHFSLASRIAFSILFPFAMLLRSVVVATRAITRTSSTSEQRSAELAAAKTLLLLGCGRSTTKNPGVFTASNLVPLRKTISKQCADKTYALPLQGRVSESRRTDEKHIDWRKHFSDQLNGRGIELGALHRPMLKHDGMQVDYVDKLSVEDLRKHYPELKELDLVELAFLDDAETLETVADNSYDFLIGAHLIEHLRNPLGTLEQWCRVVREDGLMYLVVPDKRYTFDKPRVRTTLEHIVLDYQRPDRTRDFEHFLDYATYVGEMNGNAALAEAHSLHERDYSIHFHVFLPEDVTALLEWFSANVQPLRILEGPCKAPGSDEFHFLLQV